MTATEQLRRTALYSVHQALGARIVDFHGWELPIQYASILKEHQAVRTACGIFDVSHMGQVFVEGRGALAFLQRVNSNDIGRAQPGKAVYSHLLNERGGVVDDVIVSCLAPDRYLVVVNAATREKDAAWFRLQAAGFDVRLDDQSDACAMVAVQGPSAAAVMAAVVPGCGALGRFGVLEVELYGRRCVVTRTGYTGEDGFEVVHPNELASRLWQDVTATGRSFGVQPCGLGARDTLRLEAGYLLYGQDIDDDHTPLEAGYGWVVKFDKPEFIGKAALEAQRKAGPKRRLTGIRLLERGVPRAGADVLIDGRPAGKLASATYSPTLAVGIGVGYLDGVELKPGREAAVELHGRRTKAEVCAVPFYKRSL